MRVPSPRPLASRFVAAATATAALAALLIELVAQPVIHAHDLHVAAMSLPTPWLRFLLAPIISAALFGALGAALAWPLSLFVRRGPSHAPRTLLALLLAAAFTFHGAGIAVRYASGVYATPSSLDYLLESPTQFFDQLLDSYPYALYALALGLVLTWIALAGAIAWVERRVVPRPKVTALGAWACSALVALPLVPPLLVAQEVQTTELALYASMLASRRDEARMAGQEVAVSLEGPLQSEGTAYRAKLEQLARAGGPRPNVLLIMLESVPATRFGFEGYTRDTTPNIDALAAESLRAPMTWTTATHSNYAQMAVLSSLFPRRRTRLDTYTKLDYPRVMPQDLLRPLGYDTATISSQNEDWQGMSRFQRTSTPHYFYDSHDYSGPKMGRSLEAKTPDNATVDEAISWLSRERSGPFYLYVNLQQTHFDYSLPPGQAPRFPSPSPQQLRADGIDVSYMHFEEGARGPMSDRFDSTLAFVDAQVGRLMRTLESLGVADDTIVILTADHGESFGQHGIDTHGKSLREPEARPPLFIHYPKVLEPGDVGAPVSHLDVMPTLLDLLGMPPYPGHQGQSFLDEERFREGGQAVFMTIQGIRHADSVVCYPWKLVHDLTGRRWLLYQLERDPHELRNLYDGRPRVSSALKRVLDAQIEAQLVYHARPRLVRGERYAPRLGRCPVLPD